MNENDVMTGFAEYLKDCIQAHRNDEVKCWLRHILRIHPCANNDDSLGPLLLHAIRYNNENIMKHLIIDLRVDVEYRNAMLYNSNTPLMLAVIFTFEQSIKALLKENANLEAKNCRGQTVLQMIFDLRPTSFSSLMRGELPGLILARVQAENEDIDELVDRLMAAGCTLFHAPYLRDRRIIERMLERGLDINSKCIPQRRTILHTAVQMCDSDLIVWLLDRGADVNALDAAGDSPLLLAGQYRIMKILLKRGANPNTSNRSGGTPLTTTFLSPLDHDSQCLQLLFDYGAIPQNAVVDSYLQPMLEIAFSMKMYSKIDMLIDYLSVLKMIGNPAAESFLDYNLDIRDHEVVRRRLEFCEKNLKSKRFGKLSMFELLTDSERKMRVHARNEDLVSRLREFCSSDENKMMFPYYCCALGKRIAKAARLVELEDLAISIVCEIINGNYNEWYVPARNIVGNLNKSDLRLFKSA